MANENYIAPDPQYVASSFAHQYYHLLLKSPAAAHRFYKDESVVSWPGEDGQKLVSVTTLERIDELIMSQDYEGCQVKFTSIDGQASQMGGVIAVVTGIWKGKETAKFFTEIFFLAPQEKGYYVLNDIFRFIDAPVAASTTSDGEVGLEDDDVLENVEEAPVSATTVNSTPVKDSAAVLESPKSSIVVPAVEDKVVESVVSAPSVDEQTINKPEIVTKSVEEAPKKISYASMAAKEASNSGLSAKVVVVAPSSSHYLDRPIPPKPKANNVASQNNVNTKFKDLTNKSRDKNIPQVYNKNSEGKGIFIGNLPTGISVEEVSDVFKTFGPIRKGGVQVKPCSDGFCFGFVEFEGVESATAAIKTHKMMIGTKEAYITEKKTYNQGNSSVGNGNNGGGHRNNNGGGRGRPSMGGAGGGAGYNGRSPSSDRGNDGYQVRPRSGDSGNGNYEGRRYPSAGGGSQNDGYNGRTNFGGDGRRGRQQNRNRSRQSQAQGWGPNKGQNADAKELVNKGGDLQPKVNENGNGSVAP